MATFEEANVLIDNALKALDSFVKLKLLVTGTVRNMWNYFEEGVLQPLDKLGLQKNMKLHDYFEEDYKEISEWEELTYDLKELDGHCTSTANKAFQRVKKEDLKGTLLEMCVFDKPTESAKQFGDTVVSIGQEMKTHLETAQTWHRPLFDHEKKKDKFTEADIKGFANAGEIPMLRDIEPAFRASAYYQDYLQKWMANGLFLDLLKQLNTFSAELHAFEEKLTKEVEEKNALVKSLTAAKKKAYTDLFQAVKEQKEAQGELSAAREEDDAKHEEFLQAEADAKALYDAAQAAFKTYQNAVAVFHKELNIATAVK